MPTFTDAFVRELRLSLESIHCHDCDCCDLPESVVREALERAAEVAAR